MPQLPIPNSVANESSPFTPALPGVLGWFLASIVVSGLVGCGVQEYAGDIERLDTRPTTTVAPPMLTPRPNNTPSPEGTEPDGTEATTGNSPPTTQVPTTIANPQTPGGSPSTVPSTSAPDATAPDTTAPSTTNPETSASADPLPTDGPPTPSAVETSDPLPGASTPTQPSATSTAAPPAMETASGITVDINGVEYAKEDVIAFVHVGHSNMAGRATKPESERPFFFDEVDPFAWMYKDGRWDPALEPFTAGDSESMMAFTPPGGPGTALVKEAAALGPNHIYVSLGFGKASAYCSQFLPGGLYYDSLMAAPLALKGKVTFAAIVVMLGVTERHGTTEDITGYPDCINQLATGIRTDLGEPNLPLLLTDYEMESTPSRTEDLSPASDYAKAIIPEIHRVPEVVSNSAIVPTDDISMQDDHHFDLAGHHEWVKRVLGIMVEKGWFPWAEQ